MRIPKYGRQRIVNIKKKYNITFREISQKLQKEDNIHCSRQSVSKIWKKFQDTFTTSGTTMVIAR